MPIKFAKKCESGGKKRSGKKSWQRNEGNNSCCLASGHSWGMERGKKERERREKKLLL